MFLPPQVLTDQAAEDLKRVRRILCITPELAKRVQKEVCGGALEEVISDIYMMGVKPLSSMEADRVSKVMKDLRLESDVAMEVMARVTREKFRSFVTAAQKERDRKEYAMQIKRLVQVRCWLEVHEVAAYSQPSARVHVCCAAFGYTGVSYARLPGQCCILV